MDKYPFNVGNEGNKIRLLYQENDILTVWFNAWRYEREDQCALIALIKTIAYAMAEFPTYRSGEDDISASQGGTK